MLAAALAQATENIRQLADAMGALTREPITIQITVSGTDASEADAVRRGQRPQQLEALRKAL